VIIRTPWKKSELSDFPRAKQTDCANNGLGGIFVGVRERACVAAVRRQVVYIATWQFRLESSACYCFLHILASNLNFTLESCPRAQGEKQSGA
jgi:hypothetical protein